MLVAGGTGQGVEGALCPGMGTRRLSMGAFQEATGMVAGPAINKVPFLLRSCRTHRQALECTG